MEALRVDLKADPVNGPRIARLHAQLRPRGGPSPACRGARFLCILGSRSKRYKEKPCSVATC